MGTAQPRELAKGGIGREPWAHPLADPQPQDLTLVCGGAAGVQQGLSLPLQSEAGCHDPITVRMFFTSDGCSPCAVFTAGSWGRVCPGCKHSDRL